MIDLCGENWNNLLEIDRMLAWVNNIEYLVNYSSYH